MTQDPLQVLCLKLAASFGNSLKLYGEGIRSLNQNQAANYITVDNSQPCAVNDGYLATVFYVRENAETINISGGGNNIKLARSVNYRLVANCQSLADEYTIINLINSTNKLTYNSSSYDQDGIAAGYYGISQRDTESAFFTVAFSVLETINCKKCN
jgi:hypothetical protein